MGNVNDFINKLRKANVLAKFFNQAAVNTKTENFLELEEEVEVTGVKALMQAFLARVKE